MRGTLVTDTWLGAETDPPLASHDDVSRALLLTTLTGLACTVVVLAAC
jgi:hypothetical protein